MMAFRDRPRHPPQPTRPRLTEPQGALLTAALELGGGGRESELQEKAVAIEKPQLRSSVHNHYSRAADQLVAKELFVKSIIGSHTRYWLTQYAWLHELHQEGSVPTDPEQSLF